MTAFSKEFLQDLPPKERRYDTPVAENLVFSVFPNGVKAWVHVYSYEGFVRRRTIGLFPEMDYAQAQAALSQSRRIVAVELQQGGQRRQSAGMSRGKLLLLVSGAVGGGVVIALLIRMLTADDPAPRPESSIAAVPAEAEQTLAGTAPGGPEAEPAEIPATIPDGAREAPPESPPATPDSGASGPMAATEEPQAAAGTPSPGPDDASMDARTKEAAAASGTQMAGQPAVEEIGEEASFEEKSTPESAAAVETISPEEAVETAPDEAGGTAESGVEERLATEMPAAVETVLPEEAAETAPDEAEETIESGVEERLAAEMPAAVDGPPPEDQQAPEDATLAAIEEVPAADSDTDDETAAAEGEPAEAMPPGAEPADASPRTEDGPAAGDPEDGTGEPTAAEPPAEMSVRARLTSGLADMEPTDELESPIMVAAGDTRRVYFFTEARGLFGTRVTHRWQFEGTTLTQLPFVVAGDPWPVYSSKDIPAEQAGDWEVSIVGEDGTVLASESFQVSVEAP